MDARESAIITWINSVDGLTSTCSSLEDLHDGVLLSEIVGQAAPSDIAIEDIEESPSTQAEKEKNLQTVVDGLQSFYADAYNVDDSDFASHIRIVDIASKDNLGMATSLNAIFELVIGCVINCSDKAIYIEGIQQMDPSTQTEIMHVIQGVMAKYAADGMNESLDESFATASAGITPIPNRNQRRFPTSSSSRRTGHGGVDSTPLDSAELRDLRAQVTQLQEELEAKTSEAQNLSAETQALKQEIQDSQKREKSNETERVKLLKTAMSQREVEISGGIRDLESKCAKLEQENSLLQRQVKQKDSLWKEKLQAQADELAILRSGQGRVDQLESKVQRMTTELQDVARLKTHLKEVEDQNLALEDQNSTLVAENAKIPALNKQLQAYRDKLTVRSIRS